MSDVTSTTTTRVGFVLAMVLAVACAGLLFWTEAPYALHLLGIACGFATFAVLWATGNMRRRR